MIRIARTAPKQITCNRLKSTFTPSSIDPDEMSRFTKMASEWYNPQGPYATLLRMNSLRVSYIKSFLPIHTQSLPLKNINILDVGCGGGFLSSSLKRLGGNVTGLDSNLENVKVARSQGLEVVHSTAEEFSGQYDVVTALEIIEHVVNPKEFIASCSSLTKPGGLIFVSSINRTMIAYLATIFLAESIFHWVPKGTHTYEKYVRPSEAHKYLKDCGFKIVDTKGMGYNPLTKKWRLLGSDQSSLLMNYILVARKSE